MPRNRNNNAHVSISFELPRYIVDKIDKKVGGPQSHRGVRGGRAGWIRKQVYLALGEQDTPERSERVQAEFQKWMEDVDLSLLDDMDTRTRAIINRIIELRSEGLSLSEMAQALQAEGYQTSTGKPWMSGTVHYYMGKLKRA